MEPPSNIICFLLHVRRGIKYFLGGIMESGRTQWHLHVERGVVMNNENEQNARQDKRKKSNRNETKRSETEKKKKKKIEGKEDRKEGSCGWWETHLHKTTDAMLTAIASLHRHHRYCSGHKFYHLFNFFFSHFSSACVLFFCLCFEIYIYLYLYISIYK
uniref:Uncharacterized protein n=1 Tax=Trypanosoma vivax (strain Y486) TaxID=1055687 RepID=G0TXI8_TRYVY|nr:hypothetical protein TVY486_0700220 [Trypanosoma vivax Y486]